MTVATTMTIMVTAAAAAGGRADGQVTYLLLPRLARVVIPEFGRAGVRKKPEKMFLGGGKGGHCPPILS